MKTFHIILLFATMLTARAEETLDSYTKWQVQQSQEIWQALADHGKKIRKLASLLIDLEQICSRQERRVADLEDELGR